MKTNLVFIGLLFFGNLVFAQDKNCLKPATTAAIKYIQSKYPGSSPKIDINSDGDVLLLDKNKKSPVFKYLHKAVIPRHEAYFAYFYVDPNKKYLTVALDKKTCKVAEVDLDL